MPSLHGSLGTARRLDQVVLLGWIGVEIVHLFCAVAVAPNQVAIHPGARGSPSDPNPLLPEPGNQVTCPGRRASDPGVVELALDLDSAPIPGTALADALLAAGRAFGPEVDLRDDDRARTLLTVSPEPPPPRAPRATQRREEAPGAGPAVPARP